MTVFRTVIVRVSARARHLPVTLSPLTCALRLLGCAVLTLIRAVPNPVCVSGVPLWSVTQATLPVVRVRCLEFIHQVTV